MPTPSLPTGLKPVIQGYGIGAPDGVVMTEVAGGMPRIGLQFDRGKQAYQVTFVLQPEPFLVWQMFFHHIIKQGSIQFFIPMDSGMGLQPHLSMMVPGTLTISRAGISQIWSVSFTVVAENPINDLDGEVIDSILDFWEAGYRDLDALLDRIAIFANEDTLVLDF